MPGIVPTTRCFGTGFDCATEREATMATQNGPAGGAEQPPSGPDDGKGTRPPAARKKSQKRQRNWQIKIPCLEKEFNEVAADAKAAGMTRAAYGRFMMLGKPGPRSPRRPPPDEKLLREIKGLHGKYGSNMNQIAYNGNAGKPVDLPELRRALKEWAEIRDLLNKALAEYAGPSGETPEPEGPRRK